MSEDVIRKEEERMTDAQISDFIEMCEKTGGRADMSYGQGDKLRCSLGDSEMIIDKNWERASVNYRARDKETGHVDYIHGYTKDFLEIKMEDIGERGKVIKATGFNGGVDIGREKAPVGRVAFHPEKGFGMMREE